MTVHNFPARAKGDLVYSSDFSIPTDPLDAIRREINRVYAVALASGDSSLKGAAMCLLADLGGRRRQFGIPNGRWR